MRIRIRDDCDSLLPLWIGWGIVCIVVVGIMGLTLPAETALIYGLPFGFSLQGLFVWVLLVDPAIMACRDHRAYKARHQEEKPDA